MRTRAPLEIVRRRWRWVVAVTLLAVLGALAYALASPKSYQSTSSAFFSLQYGASAADLVQGSTYTQNQVTSFARLATAPVVLDPVIERLGLSTTPGALAGRIQASAPVDTVIVEVTVTDSSPQRSAEIADAVIGSLSTTVEGLAPVDDTGHPTVRATSVASAAVPSRPSSPNLVLDIAIGLVAGLMVGLAAAWAREALDTRVRDASVVAEVTHLPVIGTIGNRSRRETQPVVLDADPYSPQAEFFRQLGTNLQFLGIPVDGGSEVGVKTVMVTSSMAGEGKSTVAANLAAALAETTARVLLVDADLRRPAVARMLGIEGAVGLSTVLIGRADVADVVQDWGTTGLQVLASGPVPPNSSELLNSPQMRRLLDQLRQRYDYVVLDAAPVLPVADATILSHSVDGTIVVANVTRVRRHQLTQTLSSLEQVGARLLGIVLNQVDRKGPSYTYQPHDGELAWDADATPPRPKSPNQGSLGGDGATQQRSEVIVEQSVTPPVGTAPSAASATQVPNRERGWALRQGEDEQ